MHQHDTRGSSACMHGGRHEEGCPMKRLIALASGAGAGLLVAALLPAVILVTHSIHQRYLGEPLDNGEDFAFFVVCFGGPAVVLVLLGATMKSITGPGWCWPECVVGLASLPVTVAVGRYLALHYALGSAGVFLIVMAGLNAAGGGFAACWVVEARAANRSR